MSVLNSLKTIFNTGAKTFINSGRCNGMSSTSSSQKMEATWTFKKTWKFPIRDTRRCYFPRPKEVKRVIHNLETRMSTVSGRRVLMRRILKDRHCIAH